MDTLQKNNYDLASAMSTLVPQGGPVLCRDEMEEWSASEAMLFEEALEKYGKDFTDIRQDFVSTVAVLGMEIELFCGLVKLTCSCNYWYHFIASSPSVAMEVSSQCGSVLLHVEDDRPLHPTGRSLLFFAQEVDIIENPWWMTKWGPTFQLASFMNKSLDTIAESVLTSYIPISPGNCVDSVLNVTIIQRHKINQKNIKNQKNIYFLSWKFCLCKALWNSMISFWPDF